MILRSALVPLAVLPGVFLLLSMLAGCADRLVLYPSTHAVDPQGARRLTVAFEGGELEMFIVRSPGCLAGSEPVAFDLEFIGNGSRAEHTAAPVAARWGNRAVEVWALNYPGYGRSSGPATLRSIPGAGLAAYDVMTKIAGGRPIIVGAHSLGCAVALHLAAHRSVSGLVLLNPPPLKELIMQRYGWWNLWLGAGAVAGGIPPQLDSLANAAKVSSPVIVLSAARDRIVPPSFHRRVYDACAGEKRWVVLDEAAHNDFPDPRTAEQYRTGIDWIWPMIVSQK